MADISFQEAFVALLTRAPSPLFPRARQLYLRKYPLEGALLQPGRPLASRFRTFLLQEEIQEDASGQICVRARRFAVVHWQARQIDRTEYLNDLQLRWDLRPVDLALVDEPWFRDGGAFAVFSATAHYDGRPPEAG